MGGLMSRNKGKRAEREVVEMLQGVLNEVHLDGEVPRLQRNTLQSDGGGADIAGLEGYAIEVKHCETFNLDGWWRQCLEQAGRSKVPVLFYRRNHAPWRVRTWGTLSTGGGFGLKTVVDVAVVDFLTSLRIRLRRTS
jgi:hypothetical protein